MGSTDVRSAGRGRALLENPWPALVTGLAGASAAFLSREMFELDAPLFVIFALIATGVGVAIRPQSPLILALAALTGFISYGGMNWDSARLLIIVLTVVAGVAALLMLLPSTVRRVAVSLIILFHFGGILTAVTSVPPRPWLSLLAWVYLYRPYLEFMYLNNAYHFYAPEPGPATFVWFYVTYEDGSGRWVKIPRREDHALALEYQRRLSLTESVNQLTPPTPVPDALVQSRQIAGNHQRIPMHPAMDISFQHREPNFYSKRMLETCARYIARTTPHPTDPVKRVRSVKIYRGFHEILTAKGFAVGANPDDKIRYWPYYQGEFDPEGKLLNPQDPYLYWLIPILPDETVDTISSASSGVFRAGVGSAKRSREEQDSDAMEFLETHAKLRMDIPEDLDPAPLPELPKATPEVKERAGAGSSAR